MLHHAKSPGRPANGKRYSRRRRAILVRGGRYDPRHFFAVFNHPVGMTWYGLPLSVAWPNPRFPESDREVWDAIAVERAFPGVRNRNEDRNTGEFNEWFDDQLYFQRGQTIESVVEALEAVERDEYGIMGATR